MDIVTYALCKKMIDSTLSPTFYIKTAEYQISDDGVLKYNISFNTSLIDDIKCRINNDGDLELSIEAS